jgi:hypothetical protein
MIDCKRCGTRHEGWETVICARARRAALTQSAPASVRPMEEVHLEVLTERPTEPLVHLVDSPPSVNRPADKDRHKPGYMAEYMRKRRAKP